MIIYLVRHGQTDWNLERRVQGREDIPLNEKGRGQAVKLADSFDGIKLDAIFTSPLIRAVETAKVLAERQKIDICIEPDLIERDYGEWSGHTIRQEDKKDLFKDIGIKDMEPTAELEARMKKVIEKIAASGYERVLCVSHGAAINSLLSVLTDGKIGSGRTWLVNTCINVLESNESGIRVLRYNLNADGFRVSKMREDEGGFTMGRLLVNKNKTAGHINKEIYGHFSEHLGRCIYGGIYVGENSDIPNTAGIRNDVIKALKDIDIPVLRWPGGCFADEYHWKDGIGPKESRKRMVNTNWGGVVEDNSFGTHEFFRLCEELGCEPYIAGNLGSGTVQELAEWVEYMTFDGESPMANLRKANGQEKPWKFKYLGIGNENWGCGGNMEPEYYSSEYKRYQSFCKNYSGNQLYKVACGPNSDDTNWTRVLLEHVKPWHTSAISLHYYTVPTGNWDHKGAACTFDDDEYYKTMKSTYFMEKILNDHIAVMDELDPENKIKLIVDEWGCWYDVEEGTNPGFLYQQNTLRDSMVAAVNLHMFNHYNERVCMANVAQVVNVLQSVILTEGDKLIKTPTYHVFEMLKGHQNATLIDTKLDEGEIEGVGIPMLNHTLSRAEDGTYLLTLANISLTETAELDLEGIAGEVIEARILTGEIHDHNTFENPDVVAPKTYHAYRGADNGFVLSVPPVSLISMKIKVSE